MEKDLEELEKLISQRTIVQKIIDILKELEVPNNFRSTKTDCVEKLHVLINCYTNAAKPLALDYYLHNRPKEEGSVSSLDLVEGQLNEILREITK